MFLTHQHAKIVDFGLIGDVEAWRYVEHNIHRPWFYVAAIEEQDDFDLHPMLMLSDEQFLQSLIADQGRGLRIHSVLLVSPDHMNESGQWMMEPLDGIERCETSDGVAYVYTVHGGKTYIYGDEEIVQRQGVPRKSIFNSTMLSPCPE